MSVRVNIHVQFHRSRLLYMTAIKSMLDARQTSEKTSTPIEASTTADGTVDGGSAMSGRVSRLIAMID